MTALTFTAASLRRVARDRTGLFFFVALPVIVIFLIGAAVRGFEQFQVGVIAYDDGPLGTAIASDLRDEPKISVHHFSGEDAARTALRRGEVSAVLVVPAHFDADVRAGQDVAVRVITGPAPGSSQAVLAALNAVVARTSTQVQAARFAAAHAGTSLDAALVTAGQVQQATPGITVRTEEVSAKTASLGEGYGSSAPTMLVLFVFVNALATGGLVIQTRQLGIYTRARAAPVRVRSIVLGETLCYFVLALLQSALIVGVGILVFGVDWGDPLAALVLVVTWALVGTGAGMLSGALFRTPEQASSIGPALGIALGMLGGCMWPLSIVTPAMRAVGHVAPHAWAVDAWGELAAPGSGLADIAGQIAVLLAVAAALLSLSTLLTRRRLIAT